MNNHLLNCAEGLALNALDYQETQHAIFCLREESISTEDRTETAIEVAARLLATEVKRLNVEVERLREEHTHSLSMFAEENRAVLARAEAAEVALIRIHTAWATAEQEEEICDAIMDGRDLVRKAEKSV